MSHPHEPDESAEMSLVMPFVNVRSVGGRFDDDAYAAGWELGGLDARLEYEHPAVHVRTIRADNAEQADLVAMHHGYQAKIEGIGVEGWSRIQLTRLSS